jgi:TP53 regulating kinase-like protein
MQEARCLVRLAKAGVSVPGVLAADWEGEAQAATRIGGAWLLMEWIEGRVVRQVVDQWEKWVKSLEKDDGSEGGETAVRQAEEEMVAFLRRIGLVIGTLHKTGVIHGDLTTSNLMLRMAEEPTDADVFTTVESKPVLDGEIVLIDFGLAGQSGQDEDKAVDLYVLERAFGSSHPRTERLFGEVLKGYGESHKGTKSTLRKLEEVRMRGRKRSMIG